MFNSTHTFVGLAIAKTGPEKWVRYAAATAVIASNLPDIDSIAGFWGTAAYLDHHRGITHSLIGVPVLSLLLAAVMYLFSGDFWRTYLVALSAMATHPVLDYLNSYGLRPFLPWNSTWYYGDSVFIFDPYLDAVLLLGLISGWRWPSRRKVAAAISLLLATAYIGVRIELHSMAAARVEELAIETDSIDKWAVLPNVWDPRVWDVIAASKTGVTKFEVCALPCRRIGTEMIPMRSAPPSDLVVRAATAPSAAALLSFARFPVTRVEQLRSGYRVLFFDFRFYQEQTSTSLASEVILDESGRVIKEGLSFVQRID